MRCGILQLQLDARMHLLVRTNQLSERAKSVRGVLGWRRGQMLVKPKRRIVDYRTSVTGLSAKDFEVRSSSVILPQTKPSTCVGLKMRTT